MGNKHSAPPPVHLPPLHINIPAIHLPAIKPPPPIHIPSPPQLPPIKLPPPIHITLPPPLHIPPPPPIKIQPIKLPPPLPKPEINMKALKESLGIIAGVVSITPVGKLLVMGTMGIADLATHGQASNFIDDGHKMNSTLNMLPAGRLLQTIANDASDGKSGDALNKYVPDPVHLIVKDGEIIGTTVLKNPSNTLNATKSVVVQNIATIKNSTDVKLVSNNIVKPTLSKVIAVASIPVVEIKNTIQVVAPLVSNEVIKPTITALVAVAPIIKPTLSKVIAVASVPVVEIKKTIDLVAPTVSNDVVKPTIGSIMSVIPLIASIPLLSSILPTPPPPPAPVAVIPSTLAPVIDTPPVIISTLPITPSVPVVPVVPVVPLLAPVIPVVPSTIPINTTISQTIPTPDYTVPAIALAGLGTLLFL